MITVRFSGRMPSPNQTKIGMETDQGCETMRFLLPQVADGQSAQLMAILPDGTPEMLQIRDGMAVIPGSMTEIPGRIRCWVEILGPGGITWNSELLYLEVGDLPPISEETERQYPTAIQDALAAAAGVETDAKAAESSAANAAEAASHYPKIENGVWYVWDVTGGEYVSTGVEAQGPSLSDEVKQALLTIAAKMVYIDTDGRTYYNALYDALYPSTPTILESITASYVSTGHTVYEGDSLDSLKPYLTVTAHYSDSTTSVISGYTLSGILTVGTRTVTVSYSGKTTTFSVTVEAVPAVLLSLSALYDTSHTVYEGDSLDSLKQYLTVTATYSDSSTETISSSNYTLSGTLTVGTRTVTVSYGGKTTTFTVTVTAAPITLSSISAVFNPNGNIVRDGDSLDSLKQYLTVTATYSDSSTETVASADYTLSGSIALASGEYDCSDQTITVTYSGKTTNFNATVYNAMTADRVALPSGYTQLSMIYSETADSGPYINTGLNSGDVDHVKYGVQVCVEPGNGKNMHVLSNNRTFYPYFRKGNGGAKNFQVKNNTSSDSATGLDTTWDINTNYVIEAYPTVKINGVTITTVADGGAAEGSKLFIFARSGSDNAPYNSAPLRFFYLQMFDGQNQLIHQYIPCKNDSNVVGMYDTVTATFHTSGNAQTFSAGGAM